MKKKSLLMLMALPFLFNSCSNDDDEKEDNSIKLEKAEYKMNFEGQEQIAATSTSEIVYQSENEYVAKVSESGQITGGRVGETKIKLSNGNDTKNVSVIIEPKSKLYPEPEFLFGETRENIIKKYGKPSSENNTAIIYDNYSSKAPMIIYAFDGTTSKSKLDGVSVIVKSSYTTELANHLRERYIMIAGEGDISLIGMNSNKTESATLMLGVQLYKLTYWMVVYLPYSKKSLKSMPVDMSKEYFHIFEEALER